MADLKISQLPVFTSAVPATDAFAVVSGGTTKQITTNQILGSGGTATLASATITGDLTVATDRLKVVTGSTAVQIGATTQTQFGTTAWPTSFVAKSGSKVLIGNSGELLLWNEAAAVSGNLSTLFVGAKSGPSATMIAGGAIKAGIENITDFSGFLTLSTQKTDATMVERYRIDSTGVATWSNVGGVAGTAMTLNSTGLGIGGSPSVMLHVQKSQNADTTLIVNNTNSGASASARLDLQSHASNYLTIQSYGQNYSGNVCGIAAAKLNTILDNALTANSSGLLIGTVSTNPLYFVTANAVKMTLDASGNLLVGKTTLESAERVSIATAAAANQCLYLRNTAAAQTGTLFVANTTTAATSAFSFADWYANGVAQFRVSGNGVIYAQNTVVQSISDLRLKENISNSTDGLDVITALRPVRYDWKAGYGNDRKNQLGFIAQEIEAVFADAVGEWELNGETYKTVGPSALIPVLVKAIQELTARVQTLEAR